MNNTVITPVVTPSTQNSKQPQPRQTAKETIAANVQSLIEPLEATPAGEVFLEYARFALIMQDRAVHLSRAAYAESKIVLHVGKSPYADPFLISALYAIQREEFRELRLDVESNFSGGLGKQVLAGVLDMAVIEEGGPDPHLSTLELASNPFYVLVREEHDVARRKAAKLEDLQGRMWIRFARHVHPDLYDRFTRSLEKHHIQPSAVQYVTTAEEAVQLVLDMDGVATMTKVGAWRVLDRGLTLRPLIADGLILFTVLAIQSDSDSPLIGHLSGQSVRSFAGLNGEMTNLRSCNSGLILINLPYFNV